MSDSLRPHELVAYQAPLSIGFSSQRYWSGLPFPSPGDLPNPGIETGPPTLQAETLPSEPQGSHKTVERNINNFRYADDTTLMAESEEKLESLDEGERGE